MHDVIHFLVVLSSLFLKSFWMNFVKRHTTNKLFIFYTFPVLIERFFMQSYALWDTWQTVCTIEEKLGSQSL